MAMEKAYKAGTGQRVFTQDYATGKFDKDGKPIIMHKGDEFNLKDFDPEEREAVKNASRVQDTKATKVTKGARELAGTLRNSLFGWSKDESINSTKDNEHKESDKKVSNEPHDNSLFNNEDYNKKVAPLQEKIDKNQAEIASENSNRLDLENKKRRLEKEINRPSLDKKDPNLHDKLDRVNQEIRRSDDKLDFLHEKEEKLEGYKEEFDKAYRGKEGLKETSGPKFEKNLSKLSKFAEHGKGLSEGLILGQIMEDAPVASFNQTGSNRLSNAQEFINNVLGGVINTALSTVASGANWIDKVNPFGNPLNSLSKQTFGVGLSPVATQLLSAGVQEFSNAGSNIEGVITGSHNVAGIMDRVGNYGQAGETIIAPPAIGQALTQQITQSTEANMQTLSANPTNAVIQTIGGQKAITTNGGNLTIGGVGTQVPVQQYVQAMQNPQMREQFAQMMAQSDLSSYGINGIGANSMQGLLQNLSQNGSILEQGTSLQQLQQAYGSDTNDGGVDTEEMMKNNRINNMSDQVEEVIDIVEDLRGDD